MVAASLGGSSALPLVRTVAQGVWRSMSLTPESRCKRTGMPRWRASMAGMP